MKDKPPRNDGADVEVSTRTLSEGRDWAPVVFVGFAVTTLVLAMTLSRLLEPTPAPPSELAPAKSVAVMPFYNLALEPSINYLTYALPDEVSDMLRGHEGLIVRPFSQTRGYIDWDPQSVGKEVSVDRVVTGQFAIEAEELRLTLEVVDVEDDRILWREGLNVPVVEIRELRARLSGLVATGLIPVFGIATSGVDLDGPQDNEAYQLYLKSLAVSRDHTRNLQAITLLEDALKLDDAFAPTWVELVARYYMDAVHGNGGAHALTRATHAAERALELDPTLVEPQRTQIVIAAEAGHLNDALDRARALVESHPRHSETRFALGFVYRYAGLLEWSQRECDRAYALDPYNLKNATCALAFMRKRRFERAEDFTAIPPGSESATETEGLSLLLQGQPIAAAEVFATLSEGHRSRGAGACLKNPNSLGAAELIRSQRDKASASRDPEGAYIAAMLLAACGDTEGAIRGLARAIEEGFCATNVLVEEAPFAPLKDHPNAEQLRRRAQDCQDRFLDHHGPNPLS